MRLERPFAQYDLRCRNGTSDANRQQLVLRRFAEPTKQGTGQPTWFFHA